MDLLGSRAELLHQYLTQILPFILELIDWNRRLIQVDDIKNHSYIPGEGRVCATYTKEAVRGYENKGIFTLYSFFTTQGRNEVTDFYWEH